MTRRVGLSTHKNIIGVIELYGIGQEEIEAIARVINGKSFSVGAPYQEVDKFEREWAQHLE